MAAAACAPLTGTSFCSCRDLTHLPATVSLRLKLANASWQVEAVDFEHLPSCQAARPESTQRYQQNSCQDI
eukprot:2646049-Amphidinium_carterae.1